MRVDDRNRNISLIESERDFTRFPAKSVELLGGRTKLRLMESQEVQLVAIRSLVLQCTKIVGGQFSIEKRGDIFFFFGVAREVADDFSDDIHAEVLCDRAAASMRSSHCFPGQVGRSMFR